MSWVIIVIIILVVVGWLSDHTTTHNSDHIDPSLNKHRGSQSGSQSRQEGQPKPDGLPDLRETNLKNPFAIINAYLEIEATKHATKEPKTIPTGPIEAFVKERKIDYIVHFTQVANIPNILKHGLLGRVALRSNDIPAQFNDKYRLDNVTDAISTSISFPNYKMFYSLQMQNPDIDWAIIKIRPSILWMANCAFFGSYAEA